MVRPKASAENLEIAAQFANAITKKISSLDLKKNGGEVHCKGSNSIFAALRRCLPTLTRLSLETDPVHKDSISELEFKKYLERIGFESYRHRHRIRGTFDRWSKGYQRWKNLRWINPEVPEDLDIMNSCLVELANKYPCFSSLRHETVVTFLASANTVKSQSFMPEGDDKNNPTLSMLEDEEGLSCPHLKGTRGGSAKRKPAPPPSPWSMTRLSTPKRCKCSFATHP
jgi:hypothetical protein